MRLYPRTLPIFIFIPPLEVLSLISLTAIVKLISAALTTSLHLNFLSKNYCVIFGYNYPPIELLLRFKKGNYNIF